MDTDREVLAAVFKARIELAKSSESEIIEAALVEYQNALAWISSDARGAGSFLWFCAEFDFDPEAVRRAVTGTDARGGE